MRQVICVAYGSLLHWKSVTFSRNKRYPSNPKYRELRSIVHLCRRAMTHTGAGHTAVLIGFQGVYPEISGVHCNRPNINPSCCATKPQNAHKNAISTHVFRARRICSLVWMRYLFVAIRQVCALCKFHVRPRNRSNRAVQWRECAIHTESHLLL